MKLIGVLLSCVIELADGDVCYVRIRVDAHSQQVVEQYLFTGVSL